MEDTAAQTQQTATNAALPDAGGARSAPYARSAKSSPFSGRFCSMKEIIFELSEKLRPVNQKGVFFAQAVLWSQQSSCDKISPTILKENTPNN